MSLVHAGTTLLGTGNGLARLADQAATYAHGPGIDIVYALATGRGTLTADDLDL
ncbi:hypothetical protein GT354_15530, partial [Streptomyces sp. SID3343]|nr:hypothetical protein [Streptomyces sp. SID3343]